MVSKGLNVGAGAMNRIIWEAVNSISEVFVGHRDILRKAAGHNKQPVRFCTDFTHYVLICGTNVSFGAIEKDVHDLALGQRDR